MAVPKDNPGGRPLKFTSVQELEDKIQAYFDYCDSRTATKVTKQGEVITIPWPRPYTISGLAVYLDCDRRTLINYSHKEEYFPTIARARCKCENWAEEQLFDGNDRGAKFSLINNYSDWTDRQEIDQKITADVSIDLPSDERQKRIDELLSKRGDK